MAVFVVLIIISNVLLSAVYYVNKVMLNSNFYQLTYYLFNGKAGSGSFKVVMDTIITCIPFALLSIIITVLPIILVKHFKWFAVKKFIKIYAISLLCFCVLLTLHSYQFDDYVINKSKKTDIYKYYKDTNKVNVSFKCKKRNLILIYLESVESSLMSKENGGLFNKSRIPELETLALENDNFSNTDKLGGGKNLTVSSFTMASLVASSSGTPLDIKIFGGYNERNKIMPEVKTLGDILKENGYNLKVIQGTDINFSATDQYYKIHGDYEIIDYNEMIKKGYVPKGYLEWWGIEDKKMFEISKKEILETAKKGVPFAVTMYTMDTHFKDGYLDSECNREFEDQLSNVYACSSKQVMEFVNWVKEQDFYKDTTIILLGDHYTMQNSYFNGYDNDKRSIYNVFINSGKKISNNKNRVFTNYDMYPTILSSIGASIEDNKLGFGVDLYSGKETLAESKGLEYLDSELKKTAVKE